MPRQRVIGRIKSSKNKNNKLTVTSRGMFFHSSSNNTPLSLIYCFGIKRKAVPEEKSNKYFPAGTVDNSTDSPLVVDDDLQMGDISGGNCSLNNNTLSTVLLFQ